MNWPNRNIVLRRLAALLLFAILVMAFAALFFFKIEPGNREDLNQRGHKALTQQVQNFLRKDQDLHNVIDNAGKHFGDLVAKRAPYDRLYNNIPYDTTASLKWGFDRHLLKTDTGVWLVVHHRDSTDTSYRPMYITVKMKDFADPIFAGRDDVFKNYLILLDSADSAGTGEVNPTGLSLLYQQLPLSATARVDADTTKRIVPNSDESGSFPLSMAGEEYIAFFSRFEFHTHHLILVGLIDKAEYARKIAATPPLFLPMVIILICVAFITLPFLKVFLLSPHESINSGDVLKMALSFYAGGVAITIIGFYFFLNYVTSMAVETRLRHLSTLVTGDVEKELHTAQHQLQTYDSTIGRLPVTDTIKHMLAKDTFYRDTGLILRVDSLCLPDSNLLVSRLFWLDTGSQPKAKWSPYNYPTPFTGTRNYTFYQLLINKPAAYDGVAGVDEPVFYPGKSNLTAEFQNFIALTSHSTWPHMVRPEMVKTDTAKTDAATFIVIADMLRASLQPVIPPGFDFSIIDNNGNVLVDGDSRKSLEGNLFEESEHNKNLLEAVRFDKTNWLFPIEIRGISYDAIVAPVLGQPLHLVCYHSSDFLQKNFNRMMHFSIHTLLLLWCMLGLCVVVSTFRQWKPMILKFNFEKVEWIRPASANSANLPAIYRWLLGLMVIAVGWSAGVALFSTTLEPLFYLSLLFPFYVLLGVQVFHQWLGRYYTGIAIVALNALIVWMIYSSTKDGWQMLPALGFQAMALAALRDAQRANGRIWRCQVTWVRCRNRLARAVYNRCARWISPGLVQRLRDAYVNWLRNRSEYFRVLYLSILLISILPTLGILTYAFFAEKVQFKKEKLDVLSTAFAKRSNYVLTRIIPSYKTPMRKKLGVPGLRELLFNSSIYLTDRDTIVPIKRAPSDTNAVRRLPDALYALLMDECYFAPTVWDDAATIPDGGAAGHGMYSLDSNMVLYAPGRVLGDNPTGANSINLLSHLQNPFTDLKDIKWPVQLSVLALLVMLALLASKLVGGAIRHLFLMEIVLNIGKRDRGTGAPGGVPTGAPGGGSDTAVARAIAGYTPASPSWLPELNALGKIDMTTFERERSWPNKPGDPPDPALQTDFILAMADYLEPVYAYIFWNVLDSDEERYILYDFAIDRYTNYKNSVVLYRLIAKGVLITKDEYPDVFSLSFRQYVLSLPEGEHAARMIAIQCKFAIPGTWQSIRIPAIAILLIMGVFLFITQPQISTFLAGLAVMATSLTTILAFVRSSISSSR